MVAKEARPRERRAARKARLTISQILEEMQHQADEKYNGNIPDNVLSIYNALSTDDRRTFLRKSLESLWELQLSYAQLGMQEIVLSSTEEVGHGGPTEKEIRISPVEIRSERESIDAANPREQKRLRAWFLRLLIVGSVVSFLAVIIFTSLYGRNDLKTIFEAASSISKLIELLLK